MLHNPGEPDGEQKYTQEKKNYLEGSLKEETKQKFCCLM
jgi:hypothetical protein